MRILRPGGGFCASMLPNNWKDRGSCPTGHPRELLGGLARFLLALLSIHGEVAVGGFGDGRYSPAIFEPLFRSVHVVY